MSVAENIYKVLDDKKAEAIVTLDVHDLTTVCDKMIIVTATSGTHLAALADLVLEYAKAAHIEVLGIEGLTEREWVLVDLGNILVHIMLQPIREYYELEKLWSE